MFDRISENKETCQMPSPISRSSNVLAIDAAEITGFVDGSAFAGTIAGFAASSPGVRPLFRATAFQGYPCLDFNAVANADMTLADGVNTALDAITTGDYTITIVFRFSDVSGIQALFTKAVAPARIFHILYDVLRRYDDNGFYLPAANAPYVWQYRFTSTGTDTGTEDYYLNGVLLRTRTGAVPARDTSSAYLIGGSSFPLKGVVPLIYVDNVAVDDATLAADRAYIKTRFAGSTRTIVCAGDSRTYGTDTDRPGNQSPFPYPTQLQALLGSGIRVINVGAGGTTAADWVTTLYARLISPETVFASPIVVYFTGANDTGAGGPDAALSHTQTLDGMMEGDGLTRLILTDVDFQWSGAEVSGEVWRAAFNSLLRSTLPTSGSRLLLDAGDDAQIGVPDACHNTALFCADRVHLHGDDGAGNPGGGYAVLAELVAGAVSTLLDDSSSSFSSLSSASSNSSESSSSDSSNSSLSTRSSESSDAEGKPVLDPIPVHNSYPAVFVNDDDPGLVSKTDEIAYRYIEVRTLRGPVTVEIESPFTNSEIRYTLNGKNPTPHSPLYTKPLVFWQNATGEKTAVKARIYDRRNSNVKSKIIRLEFRVISR